MVDCGSRVKCHCVGFQFPSELWNVWKTPSSRCCDTWYWPRKLWFGCGSACIQKVITVSYTLCLSRSLPIQTFTPQGVIDTHRAHLCSSTHNHCSMCVCVCVLVWIQPASSIRRVRKSHTQQWWSRDMKRKHKRNVHPPIKWTNSQASSNLSVGMNLCPTDWGWRGDYSRMAHYSLHSS